MNSESKFRLAIMIILIMLSLIFVSCSDPVVVELEQKIDEKEYLYRWVNEDVDGLIEYSPLFAARADGYPITVYTETFDDPFCYALNQDPNDSTIRYEDGKLILDNETGPGADGNIAYLTSNVFNFTENGDWFTFDLGAERSRFQVVVYLITFDAGVFDTLQLTEQTYGVDSINISTHGGGNVPSDFIEPWYWADHTGQGQVLLKFWVDEGDEGYIDNFTVYGQNSNLVGSNACDPLPVEWYDFRKEHVKDGVRFDVWFYHLGNSAGVSLQRSPVGSAVWETLHTFIPGDRACDSCQPQEWLDGELVHYWFIDTDR